MPQPHSVCNRCPVCTELWEWGERILWLWGHKGQTVERITLLCSSAEDAQLPTGRLLFKYTVAIKCTATATALHSAAREGG